MIVAIVSFIFGAIEVLLGLRFLFLLFGADSFVPFVAWVYDTSYPFVAPFVGIFGQPGTEIVPAGPIHSVFDITTLVALLIYAAVGGLLIGLFARRPGGSFV